MKFNKYYLMSAVFCMALASCSDDVVDDQNGNPQNPTEQVEGETTYATFSFNFSKGVLSRAARATADGTTAEQNIKNFTLLIFKYDQAHEELSTLEVIKTINATGEDATETERTVTTLVTSGPKKVYILANATKLLGQINTPDVLTLNSTLLSDFEKKVFAVAYDGGSDNMNGVLGDATNGLLMTGVADADLVSGIQVADFTSNGGGPTAAAENNVVNVAIDRASAKISMGVKDIDGMGVKTFTVPAQSLTSQHVFVDGDLSDDLGTLPLASGTGGSATPYMKFAIYNQNTSEFVVPNIGSANNTSNFVEDPNYTVGDNDNYSMYFNWTSGSDGTKQTDFYTAYDGTAHNGTTTKGLPVANLAAANEGTSLFYVPENTNQWATKGNTTYAMIEGTFVPDVSRTIDASSAANAFQSASTAGAFLFKKAGAAITAGSGFVYCEDYDAFFTAEMNGGGTLARKTTVSSAIPNLNAIKYIAAKMISDANQQATGDADAMQAKLIGGSNSGVTGYSITENLTVTATTPTGSFENNEWYAIVTADASRNAGVNDADGDNAQYFTIEVRRANSGGNALLVTATNNAENGIGSTVAYIPTQKVTIAVYPQGKCYYRVNIEDPAYSNTITPFRYAVIRNYWYQIGLSKFTALGYPNPAIAAGVASDALGADTNVQTTIEVRAWTVITMDPEVGL